MSAALRERLRKTRRSFNANFTVAKRLKIDTEEKDTKDTAGADTGCLPEASTDCSRLQDGSENLEGNGTGHTCFKSPSQESDPCGSAENSDVLQVDLGQQQCLEEKVKLEKQVQEKEELLRRLRLVKMYRSKVRQYLLLFSVVVVYCLSLRYFIRISAGYQNPLRSADDYFFLFFPISEQPV